MTDLSMQSPSLVALTVKATPKSVLRVMGVKGLTLYHLKSHLQKYRLGQQAKKHNTIEQNRENNDGSYRDYQVHSSSATTHSLGVNTEQGELPIAEALRCQVEVQKRLQEQLEVQKKLQMRIEAQGKYLQTILEKAQKSLTLDMNFPAASVEATRAQLTNFNLALSNLMENVDGEVRNENNIHKSLLNDINRKANGSLYLGEVEERKDIKLKVEGGSVNFDLNTRGSYDFIGTSRSEMEAKTLAYRS
ncbi:myb family transcription factor PHL11 isoform X2 [Camellia sinensis]|uniref:myb family transcription factor PHL11 isoform X2 n=1 Tax=Camellia sinensis TaxID=4442 RepID=UPI001035BA33|nr:myb family transcription factor PHL11 isoform X2 [Camellia sinensis]